MEGPEESRGRAAETIYSTGGGSSNGVAAVEDSQAMTEKVQVMANSIYQEFEKLIKKYDESAVKVSFLWL